MWRAENICTPRISYLTKKWVQIYLCASKFIQSILPYLSVHVLLSHQKSHFHEIYDLAGTFWLNLKHDEARFLLFNFFKRILGAFFVYNLYAHVYETRGNTCFICLFLSVPVRTADESCTQDGASSNWELIRKRNTCS